MKAKVLILKNITREGPGLIEVCLNERDIGFDIIDLDRGEPIPDFERYHGLIVLGGPDSANDDSAKITAELERIKEWLSLERPYLGVCLGMQLLVKADGGQVVKNSIKEIGFFDAESIPYYLELTDEGINDPLCANLNSVLRVFQLHGETVELTDQMSLLAEGIHCRNQIVRAERAAYGIQCHFELTRDMLRKWLEEDDDLKAIDAAEALNVFEEIYADYEKVGKSLINNFLNLITPN